jgi:DNA-binding transcriptional ArsR family regulator
MSSADPGFAHTTVDSAVVFAALGDRTRLSLLETLSDGRSRSIAGLSADRRLTRQAITKHLAVLEQAGLVSRRREGRESRFAYAPGSIGAARTYLDGVSAQWEAALERLRAFVEA